MLLSDSKNIEMKIVNKIVVFLYCLIVMSSHSGETFRLKSLESNDTNFYKTIEEVPYEALILRPLDPFVANSYCGAAIISEFWIISAASCFFRNKSQDLDDVISIENNFSIWTGVDSLPFGNTMHKLESVELPPYRSSTLFNDNISLIRLKEPIRFGDKREPIFIAKKNEMPINGDVLQVYGFSITRENDVDFLRSMSMTMVDPKTCFTNNPALKEVTIRPKDKLFCGKIDSDRPEFTSFITGSPVVFNKKLIGIMLNETIITPNATYILITNVPALYDWIVDPTNHPRPEEPFLII